MGICTRWRRRRNRPAATALAGDGARRRDAVERLVMAAGTVPAAPFEIPGATGDFRIQMLNQDTARGVVTSIVHFPPGGWIPAHRHRAGAEMHYVLEGDLIEHGETLGPGAFLTHPAGTVHGPHESRGGAKVLTVQQWQSHDGDFDFEPAEETTGAPEAERRTTEASLGKGYG